MKDIHRSLTISLCLALGLLLAFFIGRRLDQDDAIVMAFICGVVACLGCFAIRIRFW